MERSRVTIPHEVGHGMFGLFHPDDSGGVDFDGLSSPININGDTYNFMSSGFSTNSVSDPKKTRVRKYQWNEMHERL